MWSETLDFAFNTCPDAQRPRAPTTHWRQNMSSERTRAQARAEMTHAFAAG